MKRHYFISQFKWQGDQVYCLDTDIIHQIKDVLKIKIGEEVVLGDGAGKAVVAELVAITKKEIVFLVKNDLPNQPSKNKVSLFVSLLKRDSFEWLLQKTVEVGVNEIIPILSERTVKIGLNEKRCQKIIKEAAEQSQRLFLPTLMPVVSFKEAIKAASGRVVLFDPSGQSASSSKLKSKNFSIFIGPEGGWTENEIKSAKDRQATIASLGDNILRGETAAVVATYLAKNIF